MNDQPPELPKPAKQAANCKPLYEYTINNWLTIIFRLSFALFLFACAFLLPLAVFVGSVMNR